MQLKRQAPQSAVLRLLGDAFGFLFQTKVFGFCRLTADPLGDKTHKAWKITHGCPIIRDD